MAMYERRSSMESLSQWRTQSPSGSDRQKLTFNPVSEWTAPATAHEANTAVGAYEVSRTKRLLQVGIAVLYCLLAAGVVFGFAAIKPVLISEGAYRNLCTPQEVEDGVWVCYQQELRLNLMFTIAAVSTNVCALPVGTVLDRFGPRIASFVGVVFLAIGALFLAFAADVAHSLDAYIPGYLFLALGGPFIFIPSFQLSNTFPQSSGLILALLTGAFDTSSAVFLAYRLIYQHTQGAFTPKQFFLLYLIVPAFILVAQLLVMPATSYKTVGELVQQAEDIQHEDTQRQPLGPESAIYDSDSDIHSPHHHTSITPSHRDSIASEISILLGSKSGNAHAASEAAKASRSGVWGALHGVSALGQIRTPWFILITLFTILQMTRINYFVATIRSQYAYLLSSAALAQHVNEVFDIALPLGGVVAVPFIGLVLDHTSTLFVLALLVSLATLIGALGIIPHALWAAYANLALFVVYRPLYYTAVSDYAAKVFGFATFGKVYGLIICLAGLAGFAQPGLDALTHHPFRNDPRPVNIALTALAAAVGIALVAFVAARSRKLHREKLEDEAEHATESLIPGADRERVNRPHGHDTYGTA